MTAGAVHSSERARGRMARAQLVGLVVLVGLVARPLPPERGPAPYEPHQAAGAAPWAAALADSDAEWLARVAWTEDPAAVVAVMWTVRNRARGGPVGPVLLSPGQYPTATWRPRAVPRYVHELAAAVLDGRLEDPTGGATHFHRLDTPSPRYAPAPDSWRVFGSHGFYRARELARKKSFEK